ncbi:MAG: sugar phosphate isomerase/epimerase [Oscillospiraceae bacterium]|nr:sugar phosphate isomerase/epimerase [Oscillospiraceae bacterium]
MTGLTSVTFRRLGFREIIQIAGDSGLEGVEWGGDVHAPPGDAALAGEIRQATAEAGLAVLSYGSYYKLGGGAAFAPVLETALALQAGVIRVWAQGDFNRAVEDARRIAAPAKAHEITIAFEYHRNTLTETAEGALALLEAIDRENVKTYWQPNPALSHEKNLAELEAVLPWLAHVHVFHWTRAGRRLPLQAGAARWRDYLQLARPKAAILEFVKGDSAAQCARDAKVLRGLCE